jgi:outer membrane lipoprotein SlyB
MMTADIDLGQAVPWMLIGGVLGACTGKGPSSAIAGAFAGGAIQILGQASDGAMMVKQQTSTTPSEPPADDDDEDEDAA